MEFSLAFLHSFDEHGRSFPPYDLDDRSACLSFSRARYVVLSLLLCRRCRVLMHIPCIVHVVLLFFLFLSSAFVCYTHAIYVSSCASIAMASEEARVQK